MSSEKPVTRIPPWNLNNQFVRTEQYAFNGGTHADMWKAQFLDSYPDSEAIKSDVVLKMFRTAGLTDLQEFEGHLISEAQIYANLKHKHVAKFYGTAKGTWGHGIVVPMYVCNITQHLENKADIIGKLKLLEQVAQGLEYLHHSGVVHCDIRAKSVMIDDSGQAVLYDYGLQSFIDCFARRHTQSRPILWQWMGPEILSGEPQPGNTVAKNRYHPFTKETDIYAFAMLMIEVFSGRTPFEGEGKFNWISMDRRQRPLMPAELTSYPEIQALIKKCWDGSPRKRPKVEAVITELKSICCKLVYSPTSERPSGT